MNRLLLQSGRQPISWLVLWLYSAGAAATGVLSLYLLPPLYLASLALMAIGMCGIVVTSAATVRSMWRESPITVRSRPAGGRLTYAVVLAALIGAGLALLTAILVEFLWPAIASNMLAAPCDRDPSVACFSAHPDYYQETAPGGYSTPVSRIGHNIMTPAMLAAWPLGFAAALVCAAGLVKETRHRRLAILGMILGSLTMVWMSAGYLAFLVFGGGD